MSGQRHTDQIEYTGTRPTAPPSLCEPWGFCVPRAKGGIVRARKRFELRIGDEDRQRLRLLAAQTSTTESDALRALIRRAELPAQGEPVAYQERQEVVM